ncbi:MAG: BMC domain-containing protein [Clostridia bacterium]|nr:BMC domain-containing protein [Clostridia bacterium]
MEKAIALLEVQAMVTAIVGLDAMVKAADVKLIHVEKRLGGRLVTVVVEGTVSAVQAAADAGKAAAAQVGPVKLCEVIARPHPQIMRFLKTDPLVMSGDAD